MNIFISVNKLILSDLILIKAALPTGYTLAGGRREGQLEVFDGTNRVAKASVENDMVKFEVGTDLVSQEFQRKLLEKF